MTKLKKRATALLLGTVTFFIALALPYNTTRVYAVDVAFSWVVNESSNTILNWILLYLGISVAPEAISEGKVFDKTGQFAMDFCQEFFGDTFEQWYVSNGFGADIDSFKREFDNILTQDFDAAKYIAGDVKSSVLDVVYKYLLDTSSGFSGAYSSDLSTAVVGIKPGDVIPSASFTGTFKYGSSSQGELSSQTFDGAAIESCESPVYLMGVIASRNSAYTLSTMCLCSLKSFSIKLADNSIVSAKKLKNGMYYLGVGGMQYINVAVTSFSVDWNVAHFFISKNMITAVKDSSVFSDDESYYLDVIRNYLLNHCIHNIDIPNVAGKDWAYDLVGWPNAWDIDKPDVKPWDDVDSLPIPGDIAIPKEIPGVTDLPGIMDGVIGGTIPWPDVIGAVRDIDIPGPDPGPDEPDKKPEPDPELPEIPAVLPQGVSDKLKDLSGKFPFCIPFDVVDCYKSFATKDNAEAPKWDIDFTIPGTNQEYHFSVDLAMFDKYIPIFRSGVLILFFIGLLLATRKLIGWQIDN